MGDNEIAFLTLKQIVTLLISGLFTAFIIPLLKEGYRKIRYGKNSDILGDAITIFASPFIIYLLLAMINLLLLSLIAEHNKNQFLELLIVICLISISLFTIFIPLSYARNYTLIKNKFYLFRRELRKFELLKKGVDLNSENRFKIERNIPRLEEIIASFSGKYKVEYQTYYDNKEDIHFTEAIYLNTIPVKRFLIVVPKKLMFQCIMFLLIYSLQIILMFFTGPSSIQIWIFIIWILITYWGNFIISVRITGIIEKDNEKEKYISFYKENNLL